MKLLRWLPLWIVGLGAVAHAAGEYPDPTVGDMVAPAGIDPNNLVLNAGGALKWSGRGVLTSPADGVVQLTSASGGATANTTRFILGANAASGGASLVLGNTTQRLSFKTGNGAAYVGVLAEAFVYTAAGGGIYDNNYNNGITWNSGVVTLSGGGNTPSTFTSWTAAGDATFMKTVKVANAATIRSGTGSPEGSVTGGVGDIFLRTDGGAGTSFCVKESGTGNTGWVCK